jgi:selenocysteine lyase/cysteine desulfurase
MKPSDMQEKLMSRYKIYTVAIDSAGVQGCRVTPNVYTSMEELDALVNALQELGS